MSRLQGKVALGHGTDRRHDGRSPGPQSQKLELPRHPSSYDGHGKTRAFWERNLRFRTDSSKDGPEKGAPAIMPAGMTGDRASVIFAAPEEITKMIEARC